MSAIGATRLTVAGCALLSSLAGTSAGAQAHAALTPAPVVLRHEAYRINPLARQTAETTSWTIDVQRGDRAGRMLQVMVATVRGQVSIDSVMFDSATLLPVWERLAGGLVMSVSFKPGRMYGSIGPDPGEKRAIDQRIDGPVFSTTMDDIVTSRLPLIRGADTVLYFWSGDHVEIDTARVVSRRNGSSGHGAQWMIELREPGTIETLWVDDRSRRILRHFYIQRGSGLRSELVEIDARESPRHRR